MKIKRSISYLVPPSQAGRTIREYLLDKGYSSRNIIQLKEHQDAFLAVNKPAGMLFESILVVFLHNKQFCYAIKE